jgi:hypothetical protein
MKLNLKNNNINEESYNNLKNFRENQIKTNIRLHLLFIFLLVIVDLGLIFFIIIYKTKISNIKSRSSKDTSIINNNQDIIEKNNNLITKKFLNLIALSPSSIYRFSLILEKSSQVQKIKNSISSFYKDTKNMNLDINKFQMNFIFHSLMEGNTYMELSEKIYMSHNTFILFEGEKETKFGFFIEEPIALTKNNGFQYNGNNCFLISFQRNGIYKCIGDKNKFSVKNDDNKMKVIGDDDIIIKNNFLSYEENKGINNFPYKAIDVSIINENIFTITNGEFHIMGMEVFSFEFN